ncbi:hypothetical protein A8G00_08710 [Sphingobium sp. SA916]|nr:hypothetical protein A8G00_08710 [Sphingobium sp. SA916]
MLFGMFVIMQITALSLLPRTAGFTNIGWTVPVVCLYGLSGWTLSFIVHKGLPLGVAIPIASAVVPLVTIGMGIFLNQESHSPVKLLLLCSACVLAGIASCMK